MSAPRRKSTTNYAEVGRVALGRYGTERNPAGGDLIVGVRADTASVIVSQEGTNAPLSPLSADAAAALSALLHRASVKVADLAVAHERYQQALAAAEAEFTAAAEGVRA
ncbi:hypothetical protein SEA_PHELPSODU_59 [Mycobacterium phage PhelpsODU]|uniref:Uncharacterized protein n=1 Tax=Mycobacterium phage Unicorn TaxID=2015825 RepID=A0A222ZM26_9CAUD|nr:hypothetical protein I5G78_gp047 [Mycobacterium phage Unicorn]ASR85070.1 hypothetical protein SEA_UNICORN_59 [Mycobacterium phage Unicorn]ASR85169.1 hypothetical protein SEA_PHELPSODU_59 [Mycobacterium phage PhelpsODU]